MSLEAEFSKLKSFAQTQADQQTQFAKGYLITADDLGALNPDFGNALLSAETNIQLALRMNLLPALLDQKYQEIVDAFGEAGIPMPTEEDPKNDKVSKFAIAFVEALTTEEEKAAKKEKDKKAREDKDLIRLNLSRAKTLVRYKRITGPELAMSFANESYREVFSSSGEHFLLTEADPASMFEALDEDIKTKLYKAHLTPSIVAGLSSDNLQMIKGIGAKTVNRIVDNLYDAGFRVRPKEPDPHTVLFGPHP